MLLFYLYGLRKAGRFNFHYIGVTRDRDSRLRDHQKKWPGCTMVTLVVGYANYIYSLEQPAIVAYSTSWERGGSNLKAGGSCGRLGVKNKSRRLSWLRDDDAPLTFMP